MKMRRASLIPVLTLAAACGGTETLQTNDIAVAESAALSVESANQAGSLLAFVTEGLPTQTQGAIEAANAAAQLTSLLQPSGCATADQKLNTTTYTLAACTGPYGMVKLTGTVTVKFSVAAAGGLDIEVTAPSLTVGTATTVNVSASATWQAGSTSDMLVVASTTSASSTRGFAAAHMGMYTVSWDGSCIDLDGTFSTTIANATWTTAVSSYRRCAGECPGSDGMVTVTGPSGNSVTIAYSGGGTAFAQTSSGQSGTIALPCAN